MIRPTPDRRPATHPDCPHCGEPLRPVRIRGNHDRPPVTHRRCDDCGHEQDHVVEMEEAA